MKHYASAKFWQHFDQLPQDIQRQARKNYKRLKKDPSHPALHFKLVKNGAYRSVRVSLYYRALGMPVVDGILWFWIGSHTTYDKLIS